MSFKLNERFMKNTVRLDLRNPRVAPALFGEPAIGKTEAVNGLANAEGYAVFSIDVNTLSDAADLTGVRTVQVPGTEEYQQVFFPHMVIREANDYAVAHPDETVIILLDEINRTSSDVTSAALTLVTARRCGKLKLAANIRFIITGNDQGNISMLDTASLTRFAVYKVGPDAEVFMDIMGDRLHPTIRKVLEKNPELIISRPIGNQVMVSDDDDEDTSASQMRQFETMMDDTQDMASYAAPRTIEGLNHYLTEADSVDPGLLGEMLMEDAVHPRTGKASSELMLVLIAHTGDTEFTAAVAEEIGNSIRSAAPAGTSSTVPALVRPTAWDSLRAAADRTQIETIIASLDAEKQAQALVYSMATNNDQDLVKAVIDMICEAEVLEALPTEASRTLLSRGTAGELNASTMSYFFGKAGSSLVASLEPVRVYLTA